jgi:hypothetical protein
MSVNKETYGVPSNKLLEVLRVIEADPNFRKTVLCDTYLDTANFDLLRAGFKLRNRAQVFLAGQNGKYREEHRKLLIGGNQRFDQADAIKVKLTELLGTPTETGDDIRVLWRQLVHVSVLFTVRLEATGYHLDISEIGPRSAMVTVLLTGKSLAETPLKDFSLPLVTDKFQESLRRGRRSQRIIQSLNLNLKEEICHFLDRAPPAAYRYPEQKYQTDAKRAKKAAKK